MESPPPSSINPQLVNYIIQHLQLQSRYEIDHHLLEVGHNPPEIEIAWQVAHSWQQSWYQVQSKWPNQPVLTTPTQVYPLATIWQRFIAGLLDALLVFPVNLVLCLLLTGSWYGTSASLFYLCTNMIYNVGMVGRWGGTVGKLLCKIRVIKLSGEKSDFLIAVKRYLLPLILTLPSSFPVGNDSLASAISIFFSLIILLDYGFALGTPLKQTLHDKIANTTVVKVIKL